MAQRCDSCHAEVYKTIFVSGRSQWLGAECGCLRIQILRDMDNPFATAGSLTLDHVLDDSGNKVRVTSLRELRQAENKHNFEHVASNADRADWDKPRQQPAYNIGDNYRARFPRGYEQ